MGGVQWASGSGLRCGDCGGSEIDLLDEGLARCRTCGRTSQPKTLPVHAGMGRVMLVVFGAFLVVLAAEAAVSWAYALRSGASAAGTFSVLAFFTGLAAIAVAGVGALPGRVALGAQRFDQLGRMYPVRTPLAAGALLFDRWERRPVHEPGLLGVALLGGLGLVLVLVAFVFGIM